MCFALLYNYDSSVPAARTYGAAWRRRAGRFFPAHSRSYQSVFLFLIILRRSETVESSCLKV